MANVVLPDLDKPVLVQSLATAALSMVSAAPSQSTALPGVKQPSEDVTARRKMFNLHLLL
jgi:hypothetical protein